MATEVIESEGPERVLSFSFSTNESGIINARVIGRSYHQIGIRNRNIGDTAPATLGGGTLKIQTAGVADPSASNDDHWLDTDDDTLAALEIGKSYKVELAGPIRVVLSGATSPSFVVDVR